MVAGNYLVKVFPNNLNLRAKTVGIFIGDAFPVIIRWPHI
jgi:hypothetical protein